MLTTPTSSLVSSYADPQIGRILRIAGEHDREWLLEWRSAVAVTERGLTQVPVIERVSCDGEHIYVHLVDGRELGIPLAWSERLSSATQEQRDNDRIEEFGAAIHWRP